MDKGQGTHSTKMSADKSAENISNAPKLSAQIVYPSPKVWDFNEKRLHWASVVRARNDESLRIFYVQLYS